MVYRGFWRAISREDEGVAPGCLVVAPLVLVLVLGVLGALACALRCGAA